MENWAVALFIFGAVAVGVIGQGFVSFLEHRRRAQILDLIKAMLAAGKDPPQPLYDQLAEGSRPKAPWSEVVIFGALSFGFWLAFFYADGGRRTAFLVVAASLTVTAIGCLILALTRRGDRSLTRDDEQQ